MKKVLICDALHLDALEELQSLSKLDATGVEWRRTEDLAGYGLDKPSAELSIGLSGDEGIRKTVIFGFVAGANGVYAMVRGRDGIYVLEKSHVSNLTGDLVLAEDGDED